jgi:hypothetical protein
LLHTGLPRRLLQYLDGLEAQDIFLIGDVLDLTSLRRRACWPAQRVPLRPKR